MEQKQYDVLCGFMEHLTKDYNWYYDTPEQRFECTPKSIWLMNPETEEWSVELQKDGTLWWNWDFYLNFQRYFNMKVSDFESFIKVWMEDVLNREVFSTGVDYTYAPGLMEDVLNREVFSTRVAQLGAAQVMEDVLNREVFSTRCPSLIR